MKILYYDCFAGISGDMNLGAMIDLGVSPAYLVAELKKMNLEGFEILVSKQQRKGISGTRVEVVLTDNDHEHHHEHHHHGRHEHRNLSDIEKIICESVLSKKVQAISMDIFRVIASAEAKIHGKQINEVHFHEVGAIDSIVDVVGAAICIDYLAPDKILASAVEMGGGFVTCAHGRFPVPAPATLEIMNGKPVKMGAVPFETATPTGVAILAALVDEFSETPVFNVLKTGYGIGQRDTDIPNVLRVCIAESIETERTEELLLIECNIDDMNPERYSYALERLFAAGVDDAYLQNIIMKKTRPAIKISVLCAPDKKAEVERLLFTETTTLGVRYQFLKKTVLQRNTVTVETEWGPVRMKEAYFHGKKIRSKPEFDDCTEIARRAGISIEELYQKIGNDK